MRAFKIALLAAGMVAASATASLANTVYANLVDYYQGSNVTDPNRLIPSNSYGAPDGKFLSLGLAGAGVFSFGTAFGDPAQVVEITNGDRAGYVETANVYAATSYNAGTFDKTNPLASGFVLIGSIVNSSPTATLLFSGIYNFLAIVDTSAGGSDRDGYDIDSISVAAVPVPAGIALLGTGLAAFGFMGWRRKRSTAAA